MRRLLGAAVALSMVGFFGITASGVTATAAPSRTAERHIRSDMRHVPAFVRKWRQARETVADQLATGEARLRADGTVRTKSGEFVDYARQGTDRVVTLLADFTDPHKNAIAKPDPDDDNFSYWVPNFSPAHYRDMLFTPGGGTYGHPSMHDFYLQLSSGRFTVDGQVSNWVHIPAPESEYGANSRAGGDGSDDANGPYFRIIKAGLQATKGANTGIDWSTNKVDVFDRYDCDGDGNFNEPDGYVDHFQMVHAGADEAVGGGAQGPNAIWSHSSYAGQGGVGVRGPAGCLLGGYRVPGTKLWVGDYTIQSEDCAVGTFAHEFGHDLGLPDLYDTVSADENAVGFWSLMSAGSYGSDGHATDTVPVQMGPWEKYVLGWLDTPELVQVQPGERTTVTLGPAEGASTWGAQAIQVLLPPHQVTEEVFPVDGADPYYYWSSKGDDIETTITRSLGAPLASNTPLTFRADYEIEQDYDYAYVEASSNGTTFAPIDGNLSSHTDPNQANQGFGITGDSGGWVTGTYTLPAGTRAIRFRYLTDPAETHEGFAVDSIKIGSGPVDDSSDTSAWTLDGFQQAQNGQVTGTFNHYYLVENREYLRNDVGLRALYHFEYPDNNIVEYKRWNPGVLIWYRDTAYPNNDVSQHLGHGQILPVDAHPDAMVAPVGGGPFGGRRQTWDSTFSLTAHSIVFHMAAPNGTLRGKTYHAPAVTAFLDSAPDAYFDPSFPESGTLIAGSGLHIKIKSVSNQGKVYQLRIGWDA